MTALIAQVAGGYSLVQLAIIFVVVLAVIALVWIFVKNSGVPVPAWVFQVIGIVILAVIIILAIKLVASM